MEKRKAHGSKGPFDLLRRSMAWHGYTAKDMARELGMSAASISYRLNNRAAWTLPEMYFVLDRLGEPHDQLHLYFPPNGGA